VIKTARCGRYPIAKSGAGSVSLLPNATLLDKLSVVLSNPQARSCVCHVRTTALIAVNRSCISDKCDRQAVLSVLPKVGPRRNRSGEHERSTGRLAKKKAAEGEQTGDRTHE
jgi:hypothetical protein